MAVKLDKMNYRGTSTSSFRNAAWIEVIKPTVTDTKSATHEAKRALEIRMR